MYSSNEEYSKALKYCLNILSKRDYSKRRIFEKLQTRGYSTKTINEIIDYLAEKNYLNEARAVENLIYFKLEHKHWGPYKIKSNLFKKGYEIEIINKALNNIEIEQLLHCCKSAIKDYGKHNLNMKPDKLYRFLFNRGFSDFIIKQCLPD